MSSWDVDEERLWNLERSREGPQKRMDPVKTAHHQSPEKIQRLLQAHRWLHS